MNSCHYQNDRNNYARVTCIWSVQGQEHHSPGIEALFPSAALRRN